MRLVLSLRPLGTVLLTAAGLVLGGCGNASAWTNLHAPHLPGGRQIVVQGSLDANGLCAFTFSWLPPGMMEVDVARDDSTCRLVAEVAPTVPNRSNTVPARSQTRQVP
jgi:hypothetical protein